MAKQTINRDGPTNWGAEADKINTNFAQMLRCGIYDYNDVATTTTPISVPGTSANVYLTNDGAGAFTNKTYALDTAPDVWDAVANEFDFTDLQLGDTVDIRLDVDVTTSVANQNLAIDLELAIGGTAYALTILDQLYKTAEAHSVVLPISIYMGDTNTLNNAAKFRIRSDASASVVVNGWYARVLTRS